MFSLIKIVKTFTLVFIMSFPYYSHSEDTSPQKAWAKNITTFAIASGTFTQEKYFKVLKHPIRSAGEIHVDQSLGLIWQTNTPVFSSLILKNQQLFTHDGISPIKKIKGGNTLATVILQALTGNIEALNTQFTLETTERNCIQLVPKSSQLTQVIQAINLCSSTTLAQAFILDRITLLEHSGNYTKINFTLTAMNALSEAIRVQLQ